MTFGHRTKHRKEKSPFGGVTQLAAETALAHRSPTYSILLADGRSLHLRREAEIRKRDGSIDRKLALAYGGPVTWHAECDGRSCDDDSLGKALVGVLETVDPATGRSRPAEVGPFVGALLGLLQMSIPSEPPIRLESE